MKKLLAIAAVTIASTSAFAALELKYRGDYASTPEYQFRTENTKAHARSEFLGNYARLNASGMVGDASLKTSFDLLGTTAAGVLNAESMIRYLYVSKPVAEGLTVHLGKIETFLGGIESSQNELGNVYLNTLANGGNAGKWVEPGGIPGAYTVGMPTASTTLVDLAEGSPTNNRGAGLSYNYGMGQVDLILTNDSNGAADQRKHNMGIAWSGNFMDGMIKPLVGYAVGYRDTAPTATAGSTGKAATTHINVGSDFAISEAFGLTAEYFMNTGKTDTDVAAEKEEDKLTTWYLAASYKVDAWKPFLKYEMSTFKDQEANADVDATSFDRNAGTLGVEWTPAANGLSYHVAYLMANDKYKTTTVVGPGAATNDKVNWSQILVGFRATADLLK